MSFSAEVKEELFHQTGRARHCQIAELAAFIRMCGGFSVSAGDHFAIRLRTENVWGSQEICLSSEKIV